MIDKIYIALFVACFVVALILTVYALYRKFRKKKFIRAGTVIMRTKDGKIAPYKGSKDGEPIGYLIGGLNSTERKGWVTNSEISIDRRLVIDWSKVEEYENEK